MKTDSKALSALPHWAYVAFQVRCVKRYFRVVENFADNPGLKFREILSLHIQLCEESAATGTCSNPDITTHFFGFVQGYKSGIKHKPSNTWVSPPQQLFLSVIRQVEHMLKLCEKGPLNSDKKNRFVPEFTLEKHGYSWSSLFTLLQEEDLQLASRLSTEEEWTDNTPVSTDIFGPLWLSTEEQISFPHDALLQYEGCVDADSADSFLEITLDIPEGMGESDFENLIQQTVLIADGVHRAYGGKGLTVEVGDVLAESPTHTPVGGV